MSFKKGILLTLFVCSVVTTVNSCKLEPGDELENCKCLKNPDFSNHVSLKCEKITREQLQRSFAKLLKNGDGYYELEVSDSDLTGMNELPEHMNGLQILKLVKIEGLNPEALKGILSNLDELEELVLDGVANIGTLRSEIFGTKDKLESISLNNNYIKDIDGKAFENFAPLRLLSLENNELSSLPEATLKSSDLKLHLNGNPIKHIPNYLAMLIEQKNIDISLDSLACNCDDKGTSFVKYVQEFKLDSVQCVPKEEGAEKQKLKHLTDDDFCPDKGTAVVFSSLLLIITVFISFI